MEAKKIIIKKYSTKTDSTKNSKEDPAAEATVKGIIVNQNKMEAAEADLQINRKWTLKYY